MFPRGRPTVALVAAIAVPFLTAPLLITTPAAASPTAEPAAGPEPGALDGGSVVQSGWWSRSNEGPPENPLLVPPTPPAPAAPAGTLPVSVVAGERERVSAIQFALAGETDSTVDTVLLALRESTAPDANLNAAAALVRACPVTEAFWVSGENARWRARPAFDCHAATAIGTRDDAGVWRFDLTAIAADWLAADRKHSTAVVLVGEQMGAEDEPLTFQVAFDGATLDGVGLLAEVTPPVAQPSPGPGNGNSNGGGNGGGSALGTSTPPLDTGVPAPGLGDLLPGTAPLPALDPGATAAPPPATVAPTDAAYVPAGAQRLPWFDGLTQPALILVPLIAALAYLVMLAMGPGAQPAVAGRRRGVSRALDRLTPGGSR